MGVTQQRKGWRGILFLALLAMSVLVARPVCDAFELIPAAPHSGAVDFASHGGDPLHHSGHEVACCASLSQAVAVSTALTSVIETTKVTIAISDHPVTQPALRVPEAGTLPHFRQQNPLPPAAYHARSARILV